MYTEILFECVDCGYSSNSFNLVIIGNSQGAFTYAAQCPICESRKTKIVNINHFPDKTPGLEISIIDNKRMKISQKNYPLTK